MLRQTDADTDLRKQMFALAMSANKAREVSAQEVIWHLMSLPIVQFSRDVIDVPVSPVHTRSRIVPSQQTADNLPDETTDWEPTAMNTGKGLKKLYAARPNTPEWEEMTLHTFVCEWTWIRNAVKDAECVCLHNNLGYMVRRKRVAVINAIPHIPLDFLKEESCNATLILHTTWRREEEWRATFATAVEALASKISLLPQHLQDAFARIRQIEAAQEQIRSDAARGIPPVNRHETMDPVEDDTTVEELSAAQRVEQSRVSPTVSPTVFAYGTGEFAPRHNYTTLEFQRAKEFSDQQKRKLAETRNVTSIARNMETAVESNNRIEQEEIQLREMVSKLNTEQRFAYEIAVYHLIRDDQPDRKPLRLFISGPGGTGKSYLIMCIVAFMRFHFQHVPGRFGSVSVSAPTGAAACNINGSTYHSVFRIYPFNNTGGDALANLKTNLQTDLAMVRLFIVDEVSMMSPNVLGTINTRLQYAYPLRGAQPYGGAHMIFLGDLYQLAPVAAKGGYGLHSIPYEDIKQLWIRDEDAVVLLTKQMRHADAGGVSYGDINLRARDATITTEDLQVLNSRALLKLNEEPYSLEEFSDRLPTTTPVGVYSNAEVASINKHRLAQQKNPLVNCWARHTWSMRPRGTDNNNDARRITNASCLSASKSKEMWLDACVRLAVGVPVMLIRNTIVELGLVNGSVGVVYDIMYNTSGVDGPINPQATEAIAGASTPMLALPIVLVKFPHYKGESFIPGEEGIFPIQAIDLTEGSTTGGWTRWQLPLRVAYAVTLHKLQGMTLDSIALDLSNAHNRGLAYVGISRVKTLAGLFLRHKLPLRKFTGADSKSKDETQKHRDFILIAAEYIRLKRIANMTIPRYTILFNAYTNI